MAVHPHGIPIDILAAGKPSEQTRLQRSASLLRPLPVPVARLRPWRLGGGALAGLWRDGMGAVHGVGGEHIAHVNAAT